jgi:hypothetical protein
MDERSAEELELFVSGSFSEAFTFSLARFEDKLHSTAHQYQYQYDQGLQKRVQPVSPRRRLSSSQLSPTRQAMLAQHDKLKPEPMFSDDVVTLFELSSPSALDPEHYSTSICLQSYFHHANSLANARKEDNSPLVFFSSTDPLVPLAPLLQYYIKHPLPLPLAVILAQLLYSTLNRKNAAFVLSTRVLKYCLQAASQASIRAAASISPVKSSTATPNQATTPGALEFLSTKVLPYCEVELVREAIR